MEEVELQQKVKTLESETVRQRGEICTLKVEIVVLQKENRDLNVKVDGLQIENRDLSVKVDGLQMENRDLKVKVDGLQIENRDLSVKVDGLQMENRDLKVKVDGLQMENRDLNVKVDGLQMENRDLKVKVDGLQMENRDLNVKVDELKASMEFLAKKYNQLERQSAGTSTSMKNIPESPSDVPMAVPPKPSDSSSLSSDDVKSLEDEFAKLPAERLAAEMWNSTMKNLSDLSGPETIALIEKQKENFAKFVTSVSSKQHFLDAVKATCIKRGFSKGVSRKLQKQVNDIKVKEDA